MNRFRAWKAIRHQIQIGEGLSHNPSAPNDLKTYRSCAILEKEKVPGDEARLKDTRKG
jgi:hypothetical protein